MQHRATASTGYADGVYYTVHGSGPALVLVCTLAGIWSGQVPALSENHTVVTYDMRHFGRSTSRAAAYPDLAGHARDLKHLIDHLSLDRPVIVGLSHGGIVLQHFAREFPDHSAGLVFVSTLIKAVGQTRLLLNLLHGYLLDNDPAGFWRVLRTLLFSEPAFASFAQREDVLKRRIFNQLTVDCLKNIYADALAHDGTAWLPAVSTTSLVVGGIADVLFPATQTELLARYLPNSRLLMMDTAHLPPVEAPEQFNQAILMFCDVLAPRA